MIKRCDEITQKIVIMASGMVMVKMGRYIMGGGDVWFIARALVSWSVVSCPMDNAIQTFSNIWSVAVGHEVVAISTGGRVVKF